MHDNDLMLGMLESLLEIIKGFENTLSPNDYQSYNWIMNKTAELRSWDDKTNPFAPL